MKSTVLIDETEKGSYHLNSLQDILVSELKRIYWIEKELTQAIPKLQAKATDENLKTALAKHLAETKEHVTRVENSFREMEMEPVASECQVMSALIKGGDELVGKAEPGNVRDAVIILCAQKVEHFEIAVYGALIVYAEILGENKVAAYFKSTLDEEFGADNKLSDISKNVNVSADKSETGTNSKQQY